MSQEQLEKLVTLADQWGDPALVRAIEASRREGLGQGQRRSEEQLLEGIQG